MSSSDANRRPIAARSSKWAQATASFLARSRVTPNQISVASVFFAAAGAGSLGFAQDFRGPMAKQQRMAILTAGCVVGAAEWLFTGTHYVLIAAAVIIAAGSVVTCITRTLAIAARLKES